jgi:hypothetical protein
VRDDSATRRQDEPETTTASYSGTPRPPSVTSRRLERIVAAPVAYPRRRPARPRCGDRHAHRTASLRRQWPRAGPVENYPDVPNRAHSEVSIGELRKIRAVGRPRKDGEIVISGPRRGLYQVAVRMADDIFVTAAHEPTASAWLPLPWAGRPRLWATSAAATQSPITTACQMRLSGEADDDRGSGPAPARADR